MARAEVSGHPVILALARERLFGQQVLGPFAFRAIGLFVGVQVFRAIFIDCEKREVPFLAALELACGDGDIEIDRFACVFFQEFAETAVVELYDFGGERRNTVTIGDGGGT